MIFEIIGEIFETFYLKMDFIDILRLSESAALLRITAGTQYSELLPAAMLTWRERSADGPCKIKRTCSQQGRLEAVSEAVGMQCVIWTLAMSLSLFKLCGPFQWK